MPVTKLHITIQNLPAYTDKALTNVYKGAGVNRFYWSNIFNSFWFIGLLVFAAVLITSVGISAPVERDLSMTQKSLMQSHFMSVSHTGKLPLRTPKK